MLPQQFAIGGEGGQNALSSLDEDIAGLAIYRGTGSRVAQINRVAQKIIVAMVPKFVSRLGIETGHALLQICAFTQITHDVKRSEERRVGKECSSRRSRE